MAKTPALQDFLAKVMEIKVLHVSGATAGIFGYTESGHIVLDDLRKNAVAFAKERIKKQPDGERLKALGGEVEAQLQTIYVTNVISKETADKLIDELHSLMEQK